MGNAGLCFCFNFPSKSYYHLPSPRPGYGILTTSGGSTQRPPASNPPLGAAREPERESRPPRGRRRGRATRPLGGCLGIRPLPGPAPLGSRAETRWAPPPNAAFALGLAQACAWLRPSHRFRVETRLAPTPGAPFAPGLAHAPAPLTGLARKRAWLRPPSAASALGLAQARARPRPSHRSRAATRLAPPPRARPRAPRPNEGPAPRGVRGPYL